MPVAIQPPVQVGTAPDRVALSGDYRSGALCLDLFADGLTVITLVRHYHLGRRQLCNEFGSCRAVVDVTSGNLESHKQAMRISSQVDLARMAGATFADRFRLTTGRTGTLLMSLYIGAVDECPLKVGLLKLSVENAEPLAGRRPAVEAFVDRVPAAEGAGQVSPGTAHAHSVKHSLNCHPQMWLVINRLLKQNFFPASAKARH